MTHSQTPLTADQLARARIPGLPRRLATMIYDLMLVFGVVVVAAALFIIPAQALTGATDIDGLARRALQLWIVAVVLLYYGYFWSHGRQTLAMRAWRTRLIRDDGAELTGVDALRRLAFATLTLLPFGAGVLWVLFDRDGLAWYDRLSHTRPVLLAKPARQPGHSRGK